MRGGVGDGTVGGEGVLAKCLRGISDEDAAPFWGTAEWLI